MSLSHALSQLQLPALNFIIPRPPRTKFNQGSTRTRPASARMALRIRASAPHLRG